MLDRYNFSFKLLYIPLHFLSYDYNHAQVFSQIGTYILLYWIPLYTYKNQQKITSATYKIKKKSRKLDIINAYYTIFLKGIHMWFYTYIWSLNKVYPKNVVVDIVFSWFAALSLGNQGLKRANRSRFFTYPLWCCGLLTPWSLCWYLLLSSSTILLKPF